MLSKITSSEPRNIHRIDPPIYDRSWQIPEAEYIIFTQKRTTYCIVIPVINEGDKITSQLHRMYKNELMEVADVIIADGGSTDGSVKSSFLEKLNIRTLLIKQDRGGLSAQLRIGYAYALHEGYKGVITIDGNNKDSVESITDFIKALDQGYDYIQGSRYVDGGMAINTPLLRKVAMRWIHSPLVSVVARHRLTDTTNGFRGYSKRYLSSSGVSPFRDVFQSYEFIPYLASRASQLGFRIKEIPVRRVYPGKGPTPTKISPIYGNLVMMRCLLFLLIGRYNPKTESTSSSP